MEKWKYIEESDNYFVSTCGRIKRGDRRVWNELNKSYSFYKEKIIKQSTNNTKGYCRLKIYYLDNSFRTEVVHRLVALTFISNPNNYKQINHIDGNKTNNKLENLEWCNQSQNIRHSINILNNIHGVKGETNNFSVLKEKQVKQIPILIKEGKTNIEISKLFNVAPSTISEIINGRSWKHLNLKFDINDRKTSKYKNIFYRKDKNVWGYSFKYKDKTYQSCKFVNQEVAYNKMLEKKQELN
jgi:hypothetical protein